jgi:hypothetical protein
MPNENIIAKVEKFNQLMRYMLVKKRLLYFYCLDTGKLNSPVLSEC